MLSLYKGKFTFACFDVAMFVKCNDPVNLPYDKIAISLAKSPYISSWVNKTSDMNMVFGAIEDVAHKQGYDINKVEGLLREVVKLWTP
jgi:hypothetical protein